LERENQELHRQMRLAAQVQRSMLPRVLPRPPGVAFAAALRADNHLAGDFYHAFRLDRDRIGVYLGDVMGHGPAAALLSVFVMQTILPKRIEGDRSQVVPPACVLDRLNRDVMVAGFPDQPFLTMVYGILDTARRTWTYCCAGHPPPLLLRRGHRPTLLSVNAPLLGVFKAPFDQSEVALRPGDRLALYSDGVLGALWGGLGRGIDGLAARLDTREPDDLQSLVDDALRSADFDDDLRDDIALLLAQVLD
jgi:sigma-B regulation protein RsbU (phosphoserine phosphatase)